MFTIHYLRQSQLPPLTYVNLHYQLVNSQNEHCSRWGTSPPPTWYCFCLVYCTLVWCSAGKLSQVLHRHIGFLSGFILHTSVFYVPISSGINIFSKQLYSYCIDIIFGNIPLFDIAVTKQYQIMLCYFWFGAAFTNLCHCLKWTFEASTLSRCNSYNICTFTNNNCIVMVN